MPNPRSVAFIADLVFGIITAFILIWRLQQSAKQPLPKSWLWRLASGVCLPPLPINLALAYTLGWDGWQWALAYSFSVSIIFMVAVGIVFLRLYALLYAFVRHLLDKQGGE